MIQKGAYIKLLAFFASFAWFLKFSGSVLPVYFIKNNLNFSQISFGIMLSMLGQAIAVIILSRLSFSNKRVWALGVLLYMTTFSLYVIAPIYYIYFVAAFISGIASIFFYVTYGASHFEIVPRNKTGSGAATFF